MKKLINIFKRICFRGYSPIHYYFKYSKYLKDIILGKNTKSSYVNDLTFFNKEGYMLLDSNFYKLNQIVNLCKLLAKKHKIHYKTEGKTFSNFVAKDEDLVCYDEIESYVSDDYFKKIAEKYLNSKPILANVYLMLSFPTKNKQNHSQLWHLDADDTKICTFYLHCSNVGKDSGPFRLLPKTKEKKRFLPKYFRKYGYTDQEFLNSYSKKENILSLEGEKAEFVCDTANTYHCGSLCKSKSRLILGFRYVSTSPLYPLTKWANQYNHKYL